MTNSKGYGKTNRVMVGSIKWIVVACIIAVTVLALVPTVGSITGDGFTWRSFSVYSMTLHAAAAITSGDTEKLTDTIAFSGEVGPKNADEMATLLANLGNDGMELNKGTVQLFVTQEEDRFAKTTITFGVEADGSSYEVDCLTTVINKKASIINVLVVRKQGVSGVLIEEEYPDWVDKLENALSTYFPG